MTSYQKLKIKCEELERQLALFKQALFIHTTPKLEQDEKGRLFISSGYAVYRNQIDEKCKIELTKWVAENLDEELIYKLLKNKKELEK